MVDFLWLDVVMPLCLLAVCLPNNVWNGGDVEENDDIFQTNWSSKRFLDELLASKREFHVGL